MSTALELLTRAFREGNLIPLGTSPRPAELAEGLSILNSYMLSQFTMNVGDALREWPVPGRQRTAQVARDYPLSPGADRKLYPTYTHLIPPNSRVIWDGSDQHVYLADKPEDGALFAVARGSGANAANSGSLTIDGNGRLINGLDTLIIAKAALVPSRWFYRADTAQWTAIEALALTDAMIFPDEFDDVWVCGCSLRLAPRYGKVIPKETVVRGAEVLLLLQTRYFQSAPTTSGGEQLVPGYESFTTGNRGSWMR